MPDGPSPEEVRNLRLQLTQALHQIESGLRTASLLAIRVAAWEDQAIDTERDNIDKAQELRRMRGGTSISKLEADPEMRAYAMAHIHAMTFADLAQAMTEKFGPERAPSKSSIGRWWQKQRPNSTN